jgi:hypothetical protein
MVLFLGTPLYDGTKPMKSLPGYAVCAAANRGNDFCVRMRLAGAGAGALGQISDLRDSCAVP